MKGLKKKFSWFLFFLLIISQHTSVFASVPLTVDNLTTTINASGAKWTAGPTYASQLPEAARRNLQTLKLRENQNYMPGAIRIMERPTASAPASFDWRSNNGNDWSTSIQNQGSCGSCWAFGSLAVMESLLEIKAGNSQLNPDLSEQFLVSCSSGSCGGWYLDSTASFLQSDGATNESCYYYQASDLPCGDKCQNWESSIEKISNWGWVGGSYSVATVADLKANIQSGPVFTMMAVYTDFYYYNSGVYEHVSGGLEGYHAVAIFGWDDSDQCWIVKNSWGSSWGENGWFRIKMGSNESLIEQGSIWFDMPDTSDPDDDDSDPQEDDSSALYVVDQRGIAGSLIKIPVRIQSAPNDVSSLGFEITVPDTLTYNSFEWGDLIGNFDYFDCSTPLDGIVRCGGFKSTGGISEGASGGVVELLFEIDAECGGVYQLELQNLADDISDWSTVSGEFDCTSCACDLSKDGDVTPADGLCAFQKYLLIDPTDCGPIEDICCDVNQDDACTPLDSLEIYKKYQGIDSVCPDMLSK